MNKSSVAVAFQQLRASVARLQDKSAPEKSAPEKLAPEKSAPEKSAPDKSAPEKPITEKSTARSLTAQDFHWLWRSSLLSDRQSGFVLPTTILLLLMLSLVLGILIFRAGNRNTEIIGDRQQRQLYNAATPAMDRAQAKLEFLFKKEPLPPLPSDADLRNALLTDTYTLNDETRLDLDGNPATVDPAWQFDFNVDGDPTTGPNGKEVTVAYSILSQANAELNGQTVSLQDNDAAKAQAQVVRNGPINLQGGAANPNCNNLALAPRAGWQPINTAILRKPMQVNAYAKNNQTGVTATLEMQQDRQANMGNKWGAWFRYDLEIFPGPDFRWNGAMHTEANFMPVGASSSKKLQLYLVSSPASCIYAKDATEISMAGDPSNSNEFIGQVITGSMKENKATGNFSVVHNYSESLTKSGGHLTPPKTDLKKEVDSVKADVKPAAIAIDPILLYTEDQNRSRNAADPLNRAARDSDWDSSALVKERRIYNDPQNKPFVDDTYRADDRWGPRPEYTSSLVMNEDRDNDGVLDADEDSNGDGLLVRQQTGDRITAAYANAVDLIRNVADSNNETQYGYDGYWERRARAQGVRLIVGQRLELGNANGWVREDLDGDGRLDGDEDLNGNGTLDAGEDLDADGNLDRDEDRNNNGQLDVDPLNPPEGGAARDSSMADRSHEQRQWRTLRDNPAAVQTTAVYHYLSDGGRYPVACLASTAHPGTTTTRSDSRRFDELAGVAGRLNTDFLTGTGTNGIEFKPPFADDANSEGSFATAIDNANSPLRRSLTNLARLAGDPAGGFPAKQDTVGASANNAAAVFGDFTPSDAVGVVHPYPQLTLWGDFSNLRRALTYLEDDSLDGGEISDYDDLSPADQTTLHTASCTLGALAYNLENAEAQYQAALNSSGPSLEQMGNRLFRLMDGRATSGNREIGDNADRSCSGFNGSNNCPSQNPYQVNDADDPLDYRNYYAQFSPQDWVLALRSAGDTAHADKLERIYQAHGRVYQIRRDRTLGFATDLGIPGSIPGTSPGYVWGDRTYDLDQSAVGDIIQGIAEANVVYRNVTCDPSEFSLSERSGVAFATALCPSNSQPKYPSLFYLFPSANHAPDGRSDLMGRTVQQPATEPYVNASAHPYIFDRARNRGINCRRTAGVCLNDTFRPVGDVNNNGIENSGEFAGFLALANQLKMIPRNNLADWKTPVSASASGRSNEITIKGTPVYPGFLDKGFFNGRELMAVRTLDVDLDLLRRSTLTGLNRFKTPPASTTDYWLPLPELTHNGDPTRTGALFYAFREDALREDAIARPRLVTHDYGTWLSNWLRFVNNPEDGAIAPYLMNAVGRMTTTGWIAATGNPKEIATDPPVNPRTGISPKPVDFYPDPDRRPYGFRLRNGQDLRRYNGSAMVTGTADDPEIRGLSFVSDNPVYIQSDNNEFNWHTEEEFTEKLSAENWNNFYDRKTLNPKFAGKDDRWRTTEVIADAVTLLSANFEEGTIARGIRAESAGSFNGLNHSSSVDRPWVRQDGYATNNEDYPSPIKISQRGFPLYCVKPAPSQDEAPNNQPCDGDKQEVEYGREKVTTGRNNRDYIGINDSGRSNNTPDQSFFNGVIVSGIVPSRDGQSFGGLHNFPRFIETWNKLFISGSLMQLNFSTSATGPFDKDSWEPGTPPQENNEWISYYGAPGRFWGYDVALQYAPAGAVSERFVSRSDLRSEFYRELPVEDPYILSLRCAKPDGGSTRVDPDAQSCPL